MAQPTIIYRERIRELLLAAGTNGLKQRFITHHMVHKLTAAEVREQLEAWRKVGAVQKFRIDELPHRPITMWRATELLAETTEDGETYVY